MSTARDRIRKWRERRRNGTVRLVVYADALWVSDALAAAGYGHADDDGRTSLEARLQQLVDVMVTQAKV